MIPDRSTLLYKLPIPTDQRQSSKSDEDFLLVLIRSQILIPVGL
jgi:hypothetical protein